MKKLIKYILAVVLVIGIGVIGYVCTGRLIDIGNDKITFEFVFVFMGWYIIIMRPVIDYWGNKVCDLLDIKTDETQ